MSNNKTKNGEAIWSFYHFMSRFPTEKEAREHIERLRWNGVPICPHCGKSRISHIKSEKPQPYRCKDCRKHFSVKTGTVFQSSNLSLHKCLLAIYMITTAKKGIPSIQLSRELGITQKAAWHLAHRIRKTMEQTGGSLLNGEVEVDETYIGGKEKNKHANKKLRAGRGAVGKKAVVGILERGGEIVATPIDSTNKNALQGAIKANVKTGAILYTDDFRSYTGIIGYNHTTVGHSEGQYVNEEAHTNGIESFWALLKRGYHGIYHKMGAKHLHRYIDEFVTRHNLRNIGTEKRLNACIRGMIGKRLRYEDLIQ